MNHKRPNTENTINSGISGIASMVLESQRLEPTTPNADAVATPAGIMWYGERQSRMLSLGDTFSRTQKSATHRVW